MRKEYLIVVIVMYLFFAACSDKQNDAQVQRKDITEMVFASGMLEADNQYNLTAQTDGHLIQMNFEEGTLVTKGQVIAVIDNNQNIINAESAGQLHTIASNNTLSSAPALQEIKANIIAATAKVKLDEQQLERYKRLYASNSVSRTEYDNIQLSLTNSQSNLKALKEQYGNQQISANQQEIVQRYASKVSNVLENQNKITAINTGKVYVKKKQLGDYVRKGDVIAIIGNPSVIYAKLNVDETIMSKLKKGQTVMIKLNTNKTKVYKASITQILPAFDETSRSFIVKAYFDKKLDLNITGTQLEANIMIGTKKNALVIPLAYLNYGNKVMLKEDSKMITVKTGIVSNEWVEIISGLEVGQTIIKEEP
ncbi:efflux RND transporter periplasmic adaptor subunit [Flavobacterium aquatile]|uniref:Transporter n=1 Tax=Flavobacterium aquatile LMG 4008 = ATCC 11947 TaxID=1453498 RepID=A0A095SR83_9FLAO|nr:HlyD family efflux transporter periplasmic adaptor subunit [Flavobacterium aquatile]KGD66874.1 transporter [Flavobacterium aquatile LMG 4008 = ATCC 11947]OXA67967.1 transporter [Flavobacterium aquatile] [Flavobacterium aquatile LMG 4008 = ATCC 11947]